MPPVRVPYGNAGAEGGISRPGKAKRPVPYPLKQGVGSAVRGRPEQKGRYTFYVEEGAAWHTPARIKIFF